jgi:hypothetical protein
MLPRYPRAMAEPPESPLDIAYRTAVARRGDAYMNVAGLVVPTSVRVSPWPALQKALNLLNDWSMDQIEANRPEYVRLFERAILDSTRSLKLAVEERLGDQVHVAIVPWMGPRTGGPTPPQSEVVYLLGLAGDMIGRVVDLAALYVLVKGGLAKLEELTEDRLLVDEGVAILKASEAVFEASGADDLTLAFVTPLSAHRLGLDEMDPGDDGYLVGISRPVRTRSGASR